MNNSKKIVSLEQLTAKLDSLRKAGKKIILANGCFDIIHVGHVRFLQGAKKKGDVLIVALNSDKSVRQIKGDKRPILKQEERAEIVSAFECVDYVIIFNEPTVASLLQILKPDFHCKGTDYTLQSVPEKNVAKEYGGKIAIVGDPKHHSSKDLIKHIFTVYSTDGSGI